MSSAAVFDLATTVGDGDGSAGSGTPNTGYDQHSGNRITTGNTSSNNSNAADNNVYHLINPNPFIDGIFVPDGGPGGATPVQINSVGQSVFLPDTDGNSWENGKFYNAACCGTTLTVSGSPVNFATGGNTFISFHVNVGMTFDLDAVRTATGQSIERFTATVGGTDGAGDTSFRVYLDGAQVASTFNFTGTSEAAVLDIPLSSQRFLTLVGTDQDVNYGNDGFIVGNPRLTLVPEPASVSLLGLGVAAFLRRRVK